MREIQRRIVLFFSLVLLYSCDGGGQKVKELDAGKVKEPLIRINKTKVEIESEQIDGFIERRGWEMTQSGTGLRYMIYEHGHGETAMEGMTAVVKFNVSLINGTVCYSTGDKTQQFLIGMDDVVSGLHEGITYMKVGDKARLILPSHLAHGLVGDLDKIPVNATIIYDIQLIVLKH